MPEPDDFDLPDFPAPPASALWADCSAAAISMSVDGRSHLSGVGVSSLRCPAGSATAPRERDTGWEMSRENVELVRGSFENFLAGRSDFGVELLDPDVEWDATDLGTPDGAAVYRGVEGVQKFWREWLAAWETVQFEYELIDSGDRVLALIDQRMRGRSSGLEVSFGKYAHLYTFRNGSIIHWKGYRNQSEALEAVGLRK